MSNTEGVENEKPVKLIILKKDELNDKMRTVSDNPGEEETLIHIDQIKETYGNLSIKDINDSKGYEAVKSGHVKVKKYITAIGKKEKELKAEVEKYKKQITSVADELKAPLEELRDSLGEKRSNHEEEKERIKLAAERAEKERIAARKKAIFDTGAKFDGENWVLGELELSEEDLFALEDEQWSKVAEDFIAAKAKLDKEEEDRLEEERKKEAEMQRLRDELAAKEKAEADKEAQREAEMQKLRDELAAKEKAEADKEAQMEAEMQKLRDQLAAKEETESEKSESEREAEKKDELEEENNTDDSDPLDIPVDPEPVPEESVPVKQPSALESITSEDHKPQSEISASVVEQIAKTCYVAERAIKEYFQPNMKKFVKWDDIDDQDFYRSKVLLYLSSNGSLDEFPMKEDVKNPVYERVTISIIQSFL